nr:hypothetical protein [Tanacetum cinerariifolium]
MSDDDATRAESPPRGVDSYYRPGNFEDPSPIVYPAAANGAVSNFKIQSNLIAILPVFRGHEEPYAHLREFFSIADTYQVNNTTKDGVRLRLFPFSLKDQAKAWFTSLEPGSIHSWSEMQSAFLDEFDFISKTVAIRNKIKSFRQISGEQLHEAFSRLKELLRTFPHHDVPKWELVKVFYDGLDYHNQQFVMATSGGLFFSRPMEEEWEFFEKLSKGSKTQASVDRNNNHTSSANFVSNQHDTNSEISELSKKVDLLLRNLGKGVLNVSQVHTREAGKLPSYPDLNPKHKPGGPEHVNIVTYLRNGKTYNNDIKIPSVHDFSHDDEIIAEGKKADNVKSDSELVNDFLKDVPKPPTHNPKATESPKAGEGGVSSTTTPYLAALEKLASARLAKKGPHSEDMWETFKQVKINIPLIDAIKQIPAYAKFLKDLCTQKRKLKATLPKNIDLTEHVSAVLSNSLPPKFKDPGAPLISVVVGNITIKMALLDLGASINILPASLVDKYDLGTLCKTDTIIFLADRSTKIPRGILEDVIVKVDDFYYPVDFFVMDTESPYKDVQPNIILGRPFLATIDARINFRTGAMDIAFGNMKLRLNEFQMIEEEFLLSLEETPLQSQQVQQPTLNEVQEYVDCLLVHQDVLLRARGSNKVLKRKMSILRINFRKGVPNIVEPEIRTIEEVVSMADRTMEELLQASTEGYEEAIVISEILAKIFEIETNLLQLVQTNKFHGFERDNPHTHISNFKRITSTLKYRVVPNDAIKLMLFSYSLEGAARIWYEKEPPNSILTWDDLEMLRACPHHGFSELTQIDTFYNGLNEQDQDSLNAAAGGNLLSKTTREALKIIENKSKVRYSRGKSNVSRVNTNSRESSSKTDDRIDKIAYQISNLVEIVNKQVITPATVKAVEKSCVICGGAHAYYDCITTDINQSSVCAATGTYNQVSPPNRASNQMPPPGFAPVQNNQISGLAYEGPSIPTNSSPEKVVEQETKETMDKEQTNCQGSTAHIQPPVVPTHIPEPDVPKTQPKPNIPYPSTLNDQKLREKATNQMEKFFQIFHDLHFDISFADALLLMPKFASTIKSLLTNKDTLFKLAKVPLNENYSTMLLKKLLEKLGNPDKFLIPCDFLGMDVSDESVTFNLNQTMRYSSTYDDNSVNRIDVIDITCEEYAQDVLDFKYNFKSSNPTLVSNPLFSEETKRIEDSCYDLEGDILYLEKLLNDDPSQLHPMDFKQAEETKAKSSIEEPSELELKELPSHLEYAFLEETEKLPVIIAKDLKDDKEEALLKIPKTKIKQLSHALMELSLTVACPSACVMLPVLLLQEFDITIRVKKGSENLAADHLSRLENTHKDVCENKDINEKFPLETLGSIPSGSTPWFADIANFHAGNFIKKGLTSQQKKKFFKDVKHYFWDDPYLF